MIIVIKIHIIVRVNIIIIIIFLSYILIDQVSLFNKIISLDNIILCDVSGSFTYNTII